MKMILFLTLIRFLFILMIITHLLYIVCIIPLAIYLLISLPDWWSGEIIDVAALVMVLFVIGRAGKDIRSFNKIWKDTKNHRVWKKHYKVID